MKRSPLLALLLIALGWNLGIGMAALGRHYLPIVGAQVVSAEPVLLREGDHGFIAAAQVGGRFFVGYQTRPDGRLHIAEDTGQQLEEVPAPLARELAPAFQAPGEKQGSAALVADGQHLRIYYTGRAEGDPLGQFKIWRMVILP